MAKEDDIDTTADLKKVQLKSAKNMMGYADDKEISPAMQKAADMLHTDIEEDLADDQEYTCSDDDLIKCQEDREEALAEQRLKGPST